MSDNISTVKSILEESINCKKSALGDNEFIQSISTAADRIKQMITDGGTLYICGNGGSTCDAMHFVEELVARYKRDRPGIKAMHFMDPSTLTCWSNDVGFNSAFARQADTFCSSRDVFIGISTSGNSNNILEAIKAASKKGSYTIGLLGKGGGKIKEAADLSIVVPQTVTATERIQEIHITVIHSLCELIERWMLKL